MVKIGIDIGDRNCCIASVQGRVVNVISNVVEGRLMSFFVSFGERSRKFCLHAQNSHSMKIKNTIFGIKRLLGRRYSEDFVKQEKTFLPFDISEGADGFIQVDVQHLGKVEHFSVTQITAMLLSHLKQHVEKTMPSQEIECILSVPSYFKNDARLALLDAAHIANLNVKQLLNEHAAVAVYYGFYKAIKVPASEPISVAFVDMGHSSLQVSISSICRDSAKVLATASSLAVGGRDFDTKIAAKFVTKEIHQKLMGDASAALRLLNECGKFKVKMSTCDLELPFEIDNLVQDQVISGKLGRVEFEKICKPLWDIIEDTMRKALFKSGIQKVDCVELIGGATIMPAVRDLAHKVFECEPSATLPKESVIAEGCTLQCALLNGRAERKFILQDIQPYPVSLVVHHSKKENDLYAIFDVNVPVSSVSSIFHPAGLLDFYYGLSPQDCRNENKIGSLVRYTKGELQLRIDNNGILQVVEVGAKFSKNTVSSREDSKNYALNTAINDFINLLQKTEPKILELRKAEAQIRNADRLLQCDGLKRNLVQLIKKEVELIVADKNEVNRLVKKNEFEKKLYLFKDSVKADLSPFVTHEIQKQLEALNEVQDWLESGEYSEDEYEHKFKGHQATWNKLTSSKLEANEIIKKCKTFHKKVSHFEEIPHPFEWNQQVSNKHGLKVIHYNGIFTDFLKFFKDICEGKLAGFFLAEEYQESKIEEQKFKEISQNVSSETCCIISTFLNMQCILKIADMLMLRIDYHEKITCWNEDLIQRFSLSHLEGTLPIDMCSAFVDYRNLVGLIIGKDILFISYEERDSIIFHLQNIDEPVRNTEALEGVVGAMEDNITRLLTFEKRGQSFEAKIKEKIRHLKSMFSQPFIHLAQGCIGTQHAIGWKETIFKYLGLVEIFYINQIVGFVSDEEKQIYHQNWSLITDYLNEADLRKIITIEENLSQLQVFMELYLKRKQLFGSVIRQLTNFNDEVLHIQMKMYCSIDKSEIPCMRSLQHYLHFYEVEGITHFSDVMSSEEKALLQDKISIAKNVLDTKTSSVDEITHCMSSLYKNYTRLVSRKALLERLIPEINFLKSAIKYERSYDIKSLKDLTLKKELHRSGSCIIYEAELVHLKKKVAVKRFRYQSITNRYLTSLIRDKDKCDVLMNLDHKNVLKTHALFEGNGCCYIISELCSMNNIESFVKSNELSEKEPRIILKAVCEGLLYLKSKGIILNSLDFSKILMTGKNKIKIDAFCLFAKQSERFNITQLNYQHDECSAASIDTWDIGCLLYYCIKRRYPYDTRSLQLGKTYCYGPSHLGIESRSAADFISLALENDPKRKISFEDILKHEFFQDAEPSGCFMETFESYNELIIGLFDDELEQYLSAESVEEISKSLKNLKEFVFQKKSCQFDDDIVNIHNLLKTALDLKANCEASHKELDEFFKTLQSTREILNLNADYLKESSEYKQKVCLLKYYGKMINSWLISLTKDTISELPVHSQKVQEARHEFVQKMTLFLSTDS